jgi:hypothetical protein
VLPTAVLICRQRLASDFAWSCSKLVLLQGKPHFKDGC